MSLVFEICMLLNPTNPKACYANDTLCTVQIFFRVYQTEREMKGSCTRWAVACRGEGKAVASGVKVNPTTSVLLVTLSLQQNPLKVSIWPLVHTVLTVTFFACQN